MLRKLKKIIYFFRTKEYYSYIPFSPNVYFYVLPTPLKKILKNINKESKSYLFLNEFFNERAGWGNGYVAVNKGHPWYKKHYHEVNLDNNLHVHMGFTYSQKHGKYWVLGFDTAHCNDDIKKWPKRQVLKHTKEIAEYAKKLIKHGKY